MRENAKRLCDIDRGHHGGNVSNPNARDARRGHSANAPTAGFVIPKLTKEQREAEHTVAGSTTTEGAEYEVLDPRTGTIITITDFRALEFKKPSSATSWKSTSSGGPPTQTGRIAFDGCGIHLLFQ